MTLQNILSEFCAKLQREYELVFSFVVGITFITCIYYTKLLTTSLFRQVQNSATTVNMPMFHLAGYTLPAQHVVLLTRRTIIVKIKRSISQTNELKWKIFMNYQV